jgi:mannose-6-phosphate isomerase-like protein (cupin superfamily)
VSMVVVRPGDGEQAGAATIPIRIIEDGSNTEHRVAVIEATLQPSPAGPPQHIHNKHDEIFIVTEGTIRFTSGGESVDVETGGCVTIPAGVPHTFSNPFSESARFIATMSPDLYVGYFRDLAGLPADERGMPSPADIGRTMAQYDTIVVPPAGR